MSTSELVSLTLNYLDKALNRLRDIGLLPQRPDESPIVAIIQKISDLDKEKAVAIARTPASAAPKSF